MSDLAQFAAVFFVGLVLVVSAVFLFRPPPPRSGLGEKLRRETLAAIDRFCEREGFDTPRLAEHRDGRTVWFTGWSPDGRQFRFGYEEPWS